MNFRVLSLGLAASVFLPASAAAQVVNPYQEPARKAEPAPASKAGPPASSPAKPEPARVEPAKPALPKQAVKPTLLVFDLAAEQGIEKSVTNLLTELVIDKVTKLDRYTVAGQKDLAKMVFWEQNKQLQGCSDTSCLVQIAGAMGAAFYIEGSVGAVGSQYIITLKLIDAQTVRIVSRSTMRVKKDDDVMVDTVVRMVGEVFAADPARPSESGAIQAPFSDGKSGSSGGTVKAEAPRPKGWYWKWVAIGGGAALVLVGGSFTEAARNANEDYEAHKIGRENASDTIKRNNGLAVTCYVVGLGGIGTGIWLWVTEGKAGPPPATTSFDVVPLDDGATVMFGGMW